MKLLKSFEEFIDLGIVRERTPDLPRAKSLVEEATKRKKFFDVLLDKVKLSDDNANYIVENAYDILIELLRAKLLIKGFQASGQGAHESEVSYMRLLNFSEEEIRFMNSLRFFRNGILYYGQHFDTDYGQRVIKFLNNIYPKLLELVKDV